MKIRIVILFLILAPIICVSEEFDKNNPIAFIQIYERTPHKLGEISSRTSISYISSKTDLLIHFKLDSFAEDIEIEVYSEILYDNGSRKPISVPGYTTVTEIEKIIESGQNDSTTIYDYKIRSNARKNDDIVRGIIDTEIQINSQNLQSGDRVLLKVRNTEKNSEYSKIFEVQNYGWDAKVTAGAVWIKNYSSTKVNFQTAPSASYTIYYNPEPTAPFWKKFIIPGFGPHVTVLDINQTKTIGFGMFLSWLNNSIEFGSGAFLNSKDKFDDKVYYFIGVNFLEGLDILN